MKKITSIILVLIMLLLSFSACMAEAAEEIGSDAIQIPVISEMKRFEIPDNDAMRFISKLKTGWNLGNTFDANDPGTWFHGNELEIESMWCGVKTSRALIREIIPVSWHDHVDENDQVSTAWMQRVKEVVRWAVEEDLYVIVNVHHDNKKGYLYPTPAYQERSKQYMSAIWKQMNWPRALPSTITHPSSVYAKSHPVYAASGTTIANSRDKSRASCHRGTT